MWFNYMDSKEYYLPCFILFYRDIPFDSILHFVIIFKSPRNLAQKQHVTKLHFPSQIAIDLKSFSGNCHFVHILYNYLKTSLSVLIIPPTPSCDVLNIIKFYFSNNWQSTHRIGQKFTLKDVSNI